MKPIIKVEGLGKRYHIGAQQSPYGSLRETLMGAVRAPIRLLRRRTGGERQSNRGPPPVGQGR